LCLQHSAEFCPDPIDNDSDEILNEYDNVTVQIHSINLNTTDVSRKEYATDFFNKDFDDVFPVLEGTFQYVWKNVPRYRAEQLVAAIGGIVKGENYILIDF
jgi:hypothetical protein